MTRNITSLLAGSPLLASLAAGPPLLKEVRGKVIWGMAAWPWAKAEGLTAVMLLPSMEDKASQKY